MPDTSKVMTQTKRDTLVLQVSGLGVGLSTPFQKKCFIEKLLKLERQFRKRLRFTEYCNARKRNNKKKEELILVTYHVLFSVHIRSLLMANQCEKETTPSYVIQSNRFKEINVPKLSVPFKVFPATDGDKMLL